ncbi:hypothetical protein GC170_07405 [bacterium]|nr:hypothetical protein [bacterium]
MNRPELEKIVVVTRKTDLDELVERFGTRDQARFYVEKMGLDFDEYEQANEVYRDAIEVLRKSLPQKVRNQWIDRTFLPRFQFGQKDLVVVMGQDGLVVNTAKYLADQPVVAFNPDPSRFDGILLPFALIQAEWAIENALIRTLPERRVSMARVSLNDGQELFAVNDLFIGHKSHGSARYRLEFMERGEEQSSSGIIVSTGAGSTGWYSSILRGTLGVVSAYVDRGAVQPFLDNATKNLAWESKDLVFSVREPFRSRTTFARIVHGRIQPGETFRLTSRMPQSGVIFSDGVENDFLAFNSGTVAEISLAQRCLTLCMP